MARETVDTSREAVKELVLEWSVGHQLDDAVEALLDERDELRGLVHDAEAQRVRAGSALVEQLSAAERQRDELREALHEIGEGDWPALIVRAKAWGVLPDRHGADDPDGYVWQGDHGEDARYVYPSRQRLVTAVCRAALARCSTKDKETPE